MARKTSKGVKPPRNYYEGGTHGAALSGGYGEMSTKTKLTAKQQQVVNLMADGYELSWSSGMGRFCGPSATLFRKGGKSRKVPSNIGHQLNTKGVLDVKSQDWSSCVYVLSALGRSMAQKTEAQSLVKWWRLSKWGGSDIECEEFESSTDAFLIRANGHRQSKRNEYESWFPTREEAVKALHSRLRLDVQNSSRALKSAQRELANFEKREKLK